MGLSAGNFGFRSHVDTYTTPASGSTIDGSTVLFTQFTLAVSKTGPVVSWEVVVEGSLDGAQFTPILGHTDTTGDGVAMFSGALNAPCLYFRTRCVNIVLGSGTSITANVVGGH